VSLYRKAAQLHARGFTWCAWTRKPESGLQHLKPAKASNRAGLRASRRNIFAMARLSDRHLEWRRTPPGSYRRHDADEADFLTHIQHTVPSIRGAVDLRGR